MTRAGTLTCRESTGTSRPSLTTALTSPGGATKGAPTAQRSASGTPGRPPRTAPAARRMVTAGRGPERDRRHETAMAAHPAEIATAHRLRRPPPARLAAPLTNTRRTRLRCGDPGPAAGGMPVRSGPASSRRSDHGQSLQPACAAPLPPAVARRAAPRYDPAKRCRGQASVRPFRQERAGLARPHPARSSPAGTSLAGISVTRGGRALSAPARFRPRPVAAGLLVPARCRLLPPASQSPVPGAPRRSRCPSSDPAVSWRSAPLAPG